MISPFRQGCETIYMMLTDLLVPTYVQMLTALSSWLAKAKEQEPEGSGDSVMSARLATDMFPLSTQIRFACVQAQEGVFRLRDEAFPPSIDDLLSEGRDAGDHPGSIAEARARIGETIALIETLAGETEDGDPDRPIAHALPMGMIFDLTAEQYARDWALPQFYFHVITAYAILRQTGIDLGKADYVAHMFAYLRPGTMRTS